MCVQLYTCVCAKALQLCLALCRPMTVGCQIPLSGGSPGKNTGVSYHALLQGIFLTQGWNPPLLHLLHCRQIIYH